MTALFHKLRQTRWPALLRLARSIDLWLVVALGFAAYARFSRIDDFDNQYYTATVHSMLDSPKNWFFGSFDPGGVVMVDKPPGAFWVQSIFAGMFGTHTWSVNLPEALAGTAAIVALYLYMKGAFGRVAAVAAALVLVATPVSIVIDSRNEPDGLMYFTLLLAALCIIRAARTGGWQWLVLFGVLMGAAFNIKMLVAFVPLPAFLLYYVVAARRPVRQLALRMAATMAVLAAVTLFWVASVALTDAEDRPYVGSTRDNSIWTLVWEYNGINRFDRFAPPRRPPAGAPGLPPQAGQGPQAAQQQQQPAFGGPPGGGPGQPPGFPPPGGPPGAGGDAGVLGLFTNPLAGQLGWLLPLTVLAFMISLVALVPERVFRRPVELLAHLRESRAASETVLWAGWLATSVLVFGLADSTTTHPYYLVGVATPLAVVMGIGFAALWQAFRQGSWLAWGAPLALAGALAYEIFGARGVADDWAVAMALTALIVASTLMAVALIRRWTDTPLAAGGMAVAALALLVLPFLFGLDFGGRIAMPGPGARPPGALAGGPPPGLPPGGPPPQQLRVARVSSYIESRGDAGSRFVVGMLSSMDAAPFIRADVRAVAIGGFNGGDPIFTVETYRAMADRGALRYVLQSDRPPGASPPGIQGARPPGAPPPGAGRPPGPPRGVQQAILTYIRAQWQDMSVEAGLPAGTLYRYRGGP